MSALQKICSCCGQKIQEGDRYCRACGQKIIIEEKVEIDIAEIYGPVDIYESCDSEPIIYGTTDAEPIIYKSDVPEPTQRLNICKKCGFSWGTDLDAEPPRNCPKCGSLVVEYF